MLKRTISTFTLLALLAAVVCAGVYFGQIGWCIVGFITVFSTLALYEYYRLLQHAGAQPRMALGLFIGVALIPTMFYGASHGGVTARTEVAMAVPAIALLFYSIWMLYSQKLQGLYKAFSTALGVLYLPFMMSFFALLVAQFDLNGALLCVWALLATKFTDVGGLLGGMLAGKLVGKEKTHKLAPNISPNKTWEGVVGGLICSMIVGGGLVAIFNACDVWQSVPAAGTISVKAGLAATKLSMGEFTWIQGALWALPLAGMSVVSDLVESVIKRNSGDKDSGNTIPGMGGALDLLDSLVLAAPVAYYVIRFGIL